MKAAGRATMRAAAKATGCIVALAAALLMAPASAAPAVYRCELTKARTWSAGEVVTTTRYSSQPCGADERQRQLYIVESVVQGERVVRGMVPTTGNGPAAATSIGGASGK